MTTETFEQIVLRVAKETDEASVGIYRGTAWLYEYSHRLVAELTKGQEPVCHLKEQWLSYEQSSEGQPDAFPVFATPPLPTIPEGWLTPERAAHINALCEEAKREEPVAWLTLQDDTGYIHDELVTCGENELGAFPVYTVNPLPTTPDGWQLVPVEPDMKIREVLAKRIPSSQTKLLWYDILAAAPEYKP